MSRSGAAPATHILTVKPLRAGAPAGGWVCSTEPCGAVLASSKISETAIFWSISSPRAAMKFVPSAAKSGMTKPVIDGSGDDGETVGRLGGGDGDDGLTVTGGVDAGGDPVESEP